MEKRAHDSVGRRLRHKRVPEGRRVILTERDLAWFSALHRHGPLPSSYLHEFTKDTHTNFKMSTSRLKLLFHENPSYIDRPFRQFETLDPRGNELVHALTEHSVVALKELGLWSAYAPNPGGPFRHQLMVSCITASIELNAHEKGWRYIPQHQLLERAGTELAVEIGGLLRPDALFALEIEGKYLVFFLEADRATEPLGTRDIRKSFRHNVEQYRRLIGNEFYKEKFNLKASALLLNVTVSEKRRDHMTKMVAQFHPHGCTYILSHALPAFGTYFKPPRIMNLLDVKWQRASNPEYQIGEV